MANESGTWIMREATSQKYEKRMAEIKAKEAQK